MGANLRADQHGVVERNASEDGAFVEMRLWVPVQEALR